MAQNTALTVDTSPVASPTQPPYPQYPNLRPKSWQPGQSGNPGGRPSIIKSLLHHLANNPHVIETLRDRLLSLAQQDDSLPTALAAVKEITDRVDGKVPERIDVRKTQISFDISDIGQGLDMLRSMRDRAQGNTPRTIETDISNDTAQLGEL